MKGESDITEKIRSAIKAKLGQIGAYVDDELPDYIMVMIANKKSMDQIREDLSLFLGTKTERFTDWLGTLLKKLQAVDGRAEGSGEKRDETTAEITITKGKKDDVKLRKEEKAKKSEGKTKSDTKEHILKKKTDSKTKTDKSRDDKKKSSHDKKHKHDHKHDKQKDTVQRQLSDKSDKDRLDGGRDSQRRSEDGEHSRDRQLSRSRSPSSAKLEDAIEIQESADFDDAISESTTLNTKSVSLASGVSAPKRRTTNTGKIISTVTGENIPVRKVRRELVKAELKQRSPKQSTSRKRKVVSSVVGSVNLHPSDDESDDDDYLRRHSSVSGVASVIKITERKTLPISRQANPKMLVRAMQESKRSIETTIKKPLLRMDTVASVTAGTQTSPLAVNVRDKPPEKMRDAREKIKASRNLASHSPPRNHHVKEMIVTRDITDSDNSEASVEEVDSRKVHIEQIYDKYKRNLENMKRERSETPESPSPERDSKYDYQPLEERKSTDLSSDPKFIVTLDGVDPVTMTTTKPVRPMTEDDRSSTKSTEVDAVPLTSTPATQSKRQSFDSFTQEQEKNKDKEKEIETTVNDESEAMDESLTPPKVKLNEKCKFWPACKNGLQCMYHHPTVACNMFPKCAYGNECLYIHPNCRYDANCMNEHCPYTHASKRDPLAIAAVKVLQRLPIGAPYVPPAPAYAPPVPTATPIPCRFFPNCRNAQCPFLHPKQCRYGAACRNQNAGCPFSHPKSAFNTEDFPGAVKFKWCNTDNVVIH